MQWVDNELEIIGPKELVFDFLTSNGTGFCFNKIKPIPKEFLNKNQCCWEIWTEENWGVEWDIQPTDFILNKVYFRTYPTHPIPLIKHLSLKHPLLTFSLSTKDNLGHNANFSFVGGFDFYKLLLRM